MLPSNVATLSEPVAMAISFCVGSRYTSMTCCLATDRSPPARSKHACLEAGRGHELGEQLRPDPLPLGKERWTTNHLDAEKLRGHDLALACERGSVSDLP